MAAERIERTYPGHEPRQIYETLLVRLGEVATHYKLKIEGDPQELSIRVHRPGADMKARVIGQTLDINMDFGWIVPGAIRQRVKDELAQRLDTLFAKPA
jgi:hypothetical protein